MMYSRSQKDPIDKRSKSQQWSLRRITIQIQKRSKRCLCTQFFMNWLANLNRKNWLGFGHIYIIFKVSPFFMIEITTSDWLHVSEESVYSVQLIPGVGGGGVLWYFHTYVGSGHFLGFKFFYFNIFWGFQKNEYSLGYEDFEDIFGGSSQIWTILRVISMHFVVFS